MTRARNLSRLANPNVLSVDGSSNVGIGSLTPDAKLDVVGVVSATSFYGDGSNLEGITAGATLSAGSGAQRVVVTSLTSGTMTSAATDGDLSWNSSTNTLGVTSVSATNLTGALTGNVTGNVTGSSGSCSGNAGGLTGTPNIDCGTGSFTGQVLVAGTTAQAHANMDDLQVGDASGNRGITISSGSSNFGTLAFGDSADGTGVDRYAGAIEYYHSDDSMKFLTSSTPKMSITSGGLNVTGIVTATSFSGALTGNVTGNAATATLASGLTGTPDIAVTNVTSGIVTATSFSGDGSGLAGVGAWTLLSTVTASNASTAAFTSGIDSTYDTYAIICSNLQPTGTANGRQLFMRFSTNGGSSWISSNVYGYVFGNNSSTASASISGSASWVQVTGNIGCSSADSDLRGGFKIFLNNLSSSQHKTGYGEASSTFLQSSNEWINYISYGFANSTTSAINAIQFFFETDNISTGTFRLYGINNS